MDRGVAEVGEGLEEGIHENGGVGEWKPGQQGVFSSRGGQIGWVGKKGDEEIKGIIISGLENVV